jgi:hypothetical protein
MVKPPWFDFQTFDIAIGARRFSSRRWRLALSAPGAAALRASAHAGYKL